MSLKKNTPFVRFRYGTELKITPNIKESLKRFVTEYREHSDGAFGSLITDIADGSGAGISKESTWFQAVRELFDHFREYPTDVQVSVKSQYIDVLQILSNAASSEQAWEGVKGYFESNMDALSLWQFSHQRLLLMRTNSYRDEDGNVYDHETMDGEEVEVQVIDGRTLAEARYGYITNSIYSKYGSVGLLLRLCRLVFIENSLANQTDDYALVKFIMSEDGYNSWFLQGHWQVNAAKFARMIKWHPKDYFTDLSWLESDLSLVVAKSADAQAQKTTHPNAPVITEESNQKLYQRSIEGYSLQYEVALDTTLFISGENDELPDEIFVEFEGRLIRWVNGSLYRCPVLIIPTNDSTYKDAIQIAKRFVSLIIFENPYISIREITNVGHPANYYPAMIQQPRLPSITTIAAEWINNTATATTQNAWSALSFYKEAKNSDSVFYQFLNYYKIVQRAFLRPNGSEDGNACVSWIDQELRALSQDRDVNNLINDTQALNSAQGTSLSVGTYLQHTFKDAVSHVGVLDRRVRSGYPTISPDNLPDQHRYQNAIAVMERLARKTIETGMQN